jgi:type I restriction enzyme M protein
MNLLLHGIDAPDIHYQDTLSSNFPDKFPKHAQNFFDVILANPPFKGSLDFEDVHSSLLAQVKTKKTELLFVALILRMLKNGGRSATIVPDGVLFGSSKAHVALREMLVEQNQLEAVISLPSGVFRPYAGVSTGILIFTKGGETEDVFFYDMQDDGYSLDDKRTQLYDSNFAGDLPGCLASWQGRDPKKDTNRSSKAFFVPSSEIQKKNYDLSLNSYKETVHKVIQFDPPKEILKKMRTNEVEIIRDMRTLRRMLK